MKNVARGLPRQRCEVFRHSQVVSAVRREVGGLHQFFEVGNLVMPCPEDSDLGFRIGAENVMAGGIRLRHPEFREKVPGLTDVFGFHGARIDKGKVLEAHGGKHCEAAHIPADANEKQARFRDQLVIEMPVLTGGGRC